jgi:hypothetical protein
MPRGLENLLIGNSLRRLRGCTKGLSGALSESWRIFYQGVNDIQCAWRHNKILTKNPRAMLGLLLLPLGEFTSSEEETLKLMLETHLSGAVVMNEKYIVQRSSPTLLV